jgi:hypothetical protein
MTETMTDDEFEALGEIVAGHIRDGRIVLGPWPKATCASPDIEEQLRRYDAEFARRAQGQRHWYAGPT